MSEWKTIESAPKDGTPILVVDMRAMRPSAGPAFWRDESWHVGTPEDWDYWDNPDIGAEEVWGYWPSPTHWMQFPALPIIGEAA